MLTHLDIGEGALPFFYFPIPVHAVDLNFDYVLNPMDTCPNAIYIRNNWTDQHKDQKEFLYTDFKSAAQQFGQLIQEDNLSVDDIGKAQDVILSDMAENRQIPQIPADLWKNLSFVNAFTTYFPLNSLNFTRLMNTNLFYLWAQQLDKVLLNKTAGLKWYSLSSSELMMGNSELS